MKKTYKTPLTELVQLESDALMWTINTGSGEGNGGAIPR